MTTQLNDAFAMEGAAVASILRGDPECTAYRAIEARIAPSVDPSAAVDVACFMTTDTVDADDEIVLPSGADLSRFEKNPVLLLCHGYGQPGAYHALPIGRVAWTKKRPNGILAGVKFAQSTAMGRDIKALFEEGMLRSFSIGFRSLEASPLSREEAYTRPDWKAAFERTRGRVLVHRRWQLLELSAVPLPANPDALVASYQAKGRPVPSWLKFDPNSEARMKDETLDYQPGAHVCHDQGCGTIRSLHTKGSVGDGDRAIEATADDPVALIEEHDDRCRSTGQTRALRLKDVAPWSEARGVEGVATKGARPVEGDVVEDEDLEDEEVDEEEEEEYEDEQDEYDEEDEDEEGYGDEYEDEEDADKEDDEVRFRRGDSVTIRTAEYRGVGVVQGVYRRGLVPHVGEDVVGTVRDPAARVLCYKAMDDGYLPTEHEIGVRCACLVKRSVPLPPPSVRGAIDSRSCCGNESKAVTSTHGALPPLETLSDDEVQRQTLLALGRIPNLVDDAIARYMGVV